MEYRTLLFSMLRNAAFRDHKPIVEAVFGRYREAEWKYLIDIVEKNSNVESAFVDQVRRKHSLFQSCPLSDMKEEANSLLKISLDLSRQRFEIGTTVTVVGKVEDATTCEDEYGVEDQASSNESEAVVPVARRCSPRRKRNRDSADDV